MDGPPNEEPRRHDGNSKAPEKQDDAGRDCRNAEPKIFGQFARVANFVRPHVPPDKELATDD
jgi:hypothetical protein